MSQQTTVSILEGNTFVVSDRAGNIEASLADPEGVFAWDTRFLSRWVLTVDGKVPDVLSTDDLHYYAVQFFLVPGTGTIYVDADLCIIRKRSASNIGHLLWSGIAEPDKAELCVRHLMGEALFSGWGVRTMAESEGGYNPIGYHLGTVWPHDNSLIAWGLTRYGYREEAARIAVGILQAATFFNDRLPEAFAGYRRDLTRFPVEYPTACSPQAWATGTPLLLLRAILGLEPVGDRLLVDSALPKQVGWLEILDIPGAWGRTDAFGRGRIDVPIEPSDTDAMRGGQATDPWPQAAARSNGAPG
jgi:hypothetical protein